MDDHHLKRKVGTLEMVVAMLLSGSIGLFINGVRSITR
ncbi:putative membrane protein [Acinetobacter baumannii 17534]|nr:putative membrane protein [Acinetobacter baumannii 17534]